MRRPAAWLEAVAVLALVAASVLAVRDHQKGDSPTMDEPYHTFAGWEYVSRGTMWTNLEHPPLLKILAGLSLRGLGLRPPEPADPLLSPMPSFLPFLYRNAVPPPAIVDRARRPFPVLMALLVLATWLSARAFFGPAAGLLAAVLVALEPTVVGHAGLVHTDLGFALGAMATVGLAAAAAERRHVGWWAAAGVALGFSLAAKFTAVLLVPVVAGLPVLRALRDPEARSAKPLARGLASAAFAVAIGVSILHLAYAWASRRMTPDAARASATEFLRGRSATPEQLARHASLARLAPPLGLWAAGFEGVVLLSEGGRGANYLMGRVSEKPFFFYFPVALLVKSTPAFLGVLLAAALLGGRAWCRYRVLAVVLPAAVLLGAATRSHFNIGVRHVLLLYPLLAVAAGGTLAPRLGTRGLARTAAAVTALSGASLLLTHPFELSYVNAPAGGLAAGKSWLSDSNVDWGQDLGRLAAYLRERGWSRTTTLVAYGGVAADWYLPEAPVLDPSRPAGPGRYAVSAFLATAGGPFLERVEGPASRRQLEDLLARLHARGRVVGRLGGSFEIWELPPD